MPLPGTYTSGAIPKDGPLYRVKNGGQPDIRLIPTAASQTYDAGELVFVTSEAVTQIAALPSSGSVSSSLVAGDLIAGMVLDDAPASGNVRVVIANDDTEFFVRVYNATATSAELQDVAIGDNAEIFRYNNGGIAQTVISDAPNGTDGINKVNIVEKPADRSATDQYPGVWVKVRPALRRFQ